MSTEIKPTAREVRVAFNAIGISLSNISIFNDLHANGGRIKLWGFITTYGKLFAVEQMLSMMFPSFIIEVDVFTSRKGRRSTVIKYSRGV